MSTQEQHATNQVQEIAAAGFDLKPTRVITETISGSVAASERPAFGALLANGSVVHVDWKSTWK